MMSPAAPHAEGLLTTAWRFRTLLGVLVWRTLRHRYQDTTLGIAWVALQPMLLTLVFSFVFGRSTVDAGAAPTSIVVMSGVIVWFFVNQAFVAGSTSIVANADLITRVRFPRMLLPLAYLIAGYVDLAVGFGVLGVVMLWFSQAPTLGVLLLPAAILMASAACLGLALALSAIYVRVRDVSALLPFLSLVWLFTSPVIYSPSILPERFAAIYLVNPLFTVIGVTRWAIAGGPPPTLLAWTVSGSVSIGLPVLGLRVFRSREEVFADYV